MAESFHGVRGGAGTTVINQTIEKSTIEQTTIKKSSTIENSTIKNTTTIEGTIKDALENGKVLADDGQTYDTVQAAENAASDWIFVGPGTFNESVTVDTAGLTIVGTGEGTLIDGGTDGSAIDIQAADVTVRDLRVQTTAGGGNLFHGIEVNADRPTIRDVVVEDSDDDGINIGTGSTGDDALVVGCRVKAADDVGILVSSGGASDVILAACRVVASGVGNQVMSVASDTRVYGVNGKVINAQYIDDTNDLGNVSGTGGSSVSIDLTTAGIFKATLTGDTEFTFDNPRTDVQGNSFVLIVEQDGTGGRSITWPSSVEWDGGSTPSASTGANEKDWYGFISIDGGTTWLGVQSAATLA